MTVTQAKTVENMIIDYLTDMMKIDSMSMSAKSIIMNIKDGEINTQVITNTLNI